MTISTKDIQPGTYYPVARVEDSVIKTTSETPLVVYSNYSITIVDNDVPIFSWKPLVESATQGITRFDDGNSAVDTFLITAENLLFSWTDDVTPENGTIVFYYDNNDFMGNEIIISGTNTAPDGTIVSATAFPEDDPFAVGGEELDQFNWDISSVTSGRYYLVAKISNSATTVVEYSPFAIVIDKPPRFEWLSPGDTYPVSVRRGEILSLGWQSYDPDGEANINLFLDDPLRNPTDANGVGLYLGTVPDEDGIVEATFETSKIAEGTYYPLARLNDGINAPQLVYALQPVIIKANQPPTMSFVNPSEDDSDLVVSDDTFAITWVDDDPDDNATIQLFKDNNSFGADGEALEGTFNTGYGEVWTSDNIPEDDNFSGIPGEAGELNKFEWDLTEVEAGRYFIYAKISDSSTTVTIYAPGSILINKKPTFVFEEPNGYNDVVVQGRDYTIGWTDSDPDDDALIDIYLDTDKNFTNGLVAMLAEDLSEDLDQGVGDQLTFNTLPYPPGQYYPVARVSDFNNPDLIIYADYPISVTPNQPPSITLETPAKGNHYFLTNSFYILWNDEDVDDNAEINLYLDDNNSGFDGVLITEASLLEGDEDDYFILSSSQIPVKDKPYYVYAIIDDGLNPARQCYSEGTLTVPSNKTPC